jgi:hypothetical protein
MPRYCQRPGCKNFVKNHDDRFCSAAHRREDKIDQLREKRASERKALEPTPEAIAKAKSLLKWHGVCACDNCDGSCGIKPRKKPARKPAA